jgi:hypothetical protein
VIPASYAQRQSRCAGSRRTLCQAAPRLTKREDANLIEALRSLRSRSRLTVRRRGAGD